MYIYIYIIVHTSGILMNSNPLCVEYIISNHRMQETRFFSWPVAMFWYFRIHRRISQLFKDIHISLCISIGYPSLTFFLWNYSIYHIFMIGIFKYHNIYIYIYIWMNDVYIIMYIYIYISNIFIHIPRIPSFLFPFIDDEFPSNHHVWLPEGNPYTIIILSYTMVSPYS